MDNEKLHQSRLTGLRAVLVLTFIGSGATLLSYLFTGLLLPQMQAIYDSGALPVPKEATVAFETLLSRPRAFFFINAALCALSLAGAILMWQPRKNGLHYYVVAQMLMVAVALVFLGRTGVMLGDVMLSLLFIVYYFFALRSLGFFKKGERENPTDDGTQEKQDSADD